MMSNSLLSSAVRDSSAPRRLISCCRTLLSVPTPRHDALQEAALDQDRCILVDERDNVVGEASKRACHQVAPDGTLLLHRAFSVFLFNSQGDMLMQRRSKKKVTFPNVYTNACCSHPLWLGDQCEDIVTAAQRRLNHELGIPSEQMKDEDFKLLTRVRYDVKEGKWGEHELDYVLFLQKDLSLEPNMEEVDEVLYVPHKGFEQSISKFEAPLSPWFKLMLKHRLKFWWDNLHQLHRCQDSSIHSFT